jgi:hypothetical protein
VPFEGRSGADSRRLAGTATQQAGYAGGYIARTLSASGDHYTYPGGDYFDGGNTIDAVLALDGAKVGRASADAALGYLEDNVNAYVGSPGLTDPSSPETYAGPLGKLVLGVVAHGADPADFGGQDLVARLEGLLQDDGRFSDASAYGDYSNTIGQSLDLIALGRATGDVDESAIDFLLDQQCADGGFRGNLAPAGGTCTSDVDATAVATQALVGFGADAEADDALDFLEARQQDSGGFVSGDGVTNANTTGLAAQAFAAAGRSTALSAAQGFLADLQLDCAAIPDLRGGIPFSTADRATLLKEPANQAAIDKMLRATPQATLGLAGGTLLDVTSDGATATAPAADCSTAPSPTGTPSSTPTTPSATVTPPATSGPTTAAPTTDGPSTDGAVAGSDTSDDGPGLAYTGAEPMLPLLVATLLLLAGGATILVSRRRGAHQ